MKPWHTLFRNRGGGVCTLCCCLLFYVVVTPSVWAGLSLHKRQLLPLPDGFCPGLIALSGFKAWQSRAQDDNDLPGTGPDAATR